jgi:hypothetical protein
VQAYLILIFPGKLTILTEVCSTSKKQTALLPDHTPKTTEPQLTELKIVQGGC